MGDHRRIPPHVVDRPSLRAQLDVGVRAPLTLVVAPAGAGKTMLLSQWAQSRRDLPVAWLDVGAGDADVFALAGRIARAIAQVVPDFRSPDRVVGSTENTLGQPYLEDLAASLADAGPVAVVFDDLDRLVGSPVLADLWHMVELLPETTHFVFASRIDLALGWSHHRVENGLVEIRQHELAFDAGTTSRVLEAITGAPVTDETAIAVTERTEGWAAGVQLTALSLRFAADPDRIMDELGDSGRLVVDYLSEEVLDAMDPSRRLALKRLAVVDQFDAGLVEAVTGQPGEQFIAALERDSLFVLPVPGEPGWHRFHRLFRDLLLLRLRLRYPREESDVLAIAARWCADAHREADTIEYLLRGEHFDEAVARILALGRDLYEQQRMPTVARWLGRVPEELRARHPDAEILRAIAEGMSGRGTVAVDAMRTLLSERPLTVGQRQIALTYLAASVQLHPQTDLFADAARRALASLDEAPDAERPALLGLTSGALLRVVALGSLGRAHLFRGELVAARTALTAALAEDGIAYRPFRIHVLGSLAIAETLAGRLTAATEHSDEALALATEFGLLAHPATADAFLARAMVAVQRGRPDVGGLALTESAVRAASNQRTQLMWLVRTASLIIDAHDGQELGPEPPGAPPPFARAAAAAIAMRRSRLRGAAVLPATPSAVWSLVAFEEIAALLSLDRPALARQRMAEIRFEPDPLVPVILIERDLLLGWLCALEGRRASSREHLLAALARAQPEWLVHPFVRAGPVVADLVDSLPGVGDEFRRLVVRRGRAAAVTPRQPLADELTPRERELLAYLPTRLTIAEIAARCYVSTNTVKTHMGHIYRKLGASGRDGAIARAAELGLLSDADVVHAG